MTVSDPQRTESVVCILYNCEVMAALADLTGSVSRRLEPTGRVPSGSCVAVSTSDGRTARRGRKTTTRCPLSAPLALTRSKKSMPSTRSSWKLALIISVGIYISLFSEMIQTTAQS